MPTATLFFDESGYTGRALLDPVQPFFTVASTILPEGQAEEILRRSFVEFGGRELKFQALWRRATHRRGLLRFAAELPAVRDSLFIWCVDKRFCVLTKLVDDLIEPQIYAKGFDFYADAHAPKFCNYIYAAIHALASPQLYQSTIEAYSAFARSPSEASLQRLRAQLHLFAGSVPEGLRWFYELAAAGADHFYRYHDPEAFEGTFEIQLSAVLTSVGYWRSRYQDDFRVLHDESNNFFRQRGLWEAVTSPEVPAQVHPGLNGPPMEFPLRVVETRACDSSQHAGIQFCDVLAGMVTRVHRPANNDEDAELIEQLIAIGLGELNSPGIRPHDDMPDAPPRRRDGPDVVDLLMNVMFPALG